jgi:hypothetical protein
MSFHDLPYEANEVRIAGLRREAEVYRASRAAVRVRRARARRRWRLLRRHAVTARLSATARVINEVIGAIVSPPWPSESEPSRYWSRPSAGR